MHIAFGWLHSDIFATSHHKMYTGVCVYACDYKRWKIKMRIHFKIFLACSLWTANALEWNYALCAHYNHQPAKLFIVMFMLPVATREWFPFCFVLPSVVVLIILFVVFAFGCIVVVLFSVSLVRFSCASFALRFCHVMYWSAAAQQHPK